MYLTFDEFLEYGGGIADENVYNRHEFRARMLIDLMTLGRIDDSVRKTEQLKRCMYELIETYEQQRTQASDMIGVSSVSNDGVSVSYSGTDANAVVKKRCTEIIGQYPANVCDASGTNVLYKGVIV